MSTDRFENVTILKNANIYFDGRVTSRNILFADGTRKTLGLMLPGEYTFNTGLREVVELLNGELDVLLPGRTAWQAIKTGGTFEVSADSSFQLKVNVPVDYCCSYG